MMQDRKSRSTTAIMTVGVLAAVFGLLLLVKAQVQGADYLTFHFNTARTGWNDREATLTPANVQSNLHKLWEYNEINGQIYAAPLLYRVNAGGRDTDLMFIATQTNWIYAFDVTDGRPAEPEWSHVIGSLDGRPERALTQDEFESKLRGGCGDISPWHGVTGTPVIDPVTNIMYFVNLTMEDLQQVYKAHAIDIFTGREINDPRWPVRLEGSYGGRDFQAFMQTQRASLTFHNGTLYIPFSSRCDATDWQGWVFGIDVSNGQRRFIFNTAPDGNGAGIWGQGGMSIDPANGLGYFATGNGTVNHFLQTPGRSYGMSVLRLDLSNPEDPFQYKNPDHFYTIPDHPGANARDTDLGGSSTLMVPVQKGTTTPHLLITAGKDGRVYMVNRNSLGGLSRPLAEQTEVQFLRVSRGQRVAPTYYEDPSGRPYFYITSGEGGANTIGTYTDWEDSPINMETPEELTRAAAGSGPSLVGFNNRLFLAWVNRSDNREILMKSSSADGADWSSTASDAVGGFAATRSSPSLAVFNGRLYIAWIDNETGRIKVKSSDDAESWSGDHTLDHVATGTYLSLAEFRGRLYVAYIAGSPNGDIQVQSTGEGKVWSGPVSVSGQTVPMSAPFIISFDEKLYAFWLRANTDTDRQIVFKTSTNGTNWQPTGAPTMFNESADFRSGLGGFVVNSIVESIVENDPTLQNGPPRLHILFLENGRNPRIRVKSISRTGILETGNVDTNERAFGATQVGATVFRGRPVFAYVSNNPNLRNLLLKPGAVGFRGGGLIALQLRVDPEGRSRFFPAWTSGRIPGSDENLPPTAYDYLPGMPLVTSNGRENAIVWVTEGLGNNPRLRAYNAVTGADLFNSENRRPTDRITNGGRKFVSTVVVNGKVYVVTNGIHCYGLSD